MRLITFSLLLCIPWSAADAAGVPTAPAETRVHPTACQFFIDIIRDEFAVGAGSGVRVHVIPV
ncbi:hypothetical protein [Cupriavidus basilensis]|uniref:hypothetical protein n=1 Tax=Cupriavidus basilensis TaxID=68895 RepID=UPI0039F67CB7